MKMWITWKHRT